MELVVKNVTFAYSAEVVALKDVSVTFLSGESVAIIGETGAGKSTLAKHLNGLLRPAGGRVMVGDWDAREHSAAQLAARVGFAFQNPDDQLFKRSVYAEVALGPQNLGFEDDEIEAAVAEALRMTGLMADAAAHPHDLHSSKRRMVALAATLAMGTPIVVIDEPTIGQDAGGRKQLSDIIAQLKDDGRTVIAISHDIDFCAQNFDRVVVMSNGRIAADGSARAVFNQVSLLAGAHVEPPQVTRLAAELGMAGGIIDSASFMAALRDQMR